MVYKVTEDQPILTDQSMPSDKDSMAACLSVPIGFFQDSNCSLKVIYNHLQDCVRH